MPCTTHAVIKVLLEIYHEFDSPASLYLSTGNWVLWLRYAEWLLTCPVILIHLSNLTGLKDDYSKRTMRLLVSDIGCVVWGITSAMATGYLKVGQQLCTDCGGVLPPRGSPEGLFSFFCHTELIR